MRFCIVCKQEIDPERAAERPETKLCGEHAREIVQYGGEFRLSASQEKTSKKNSFKHNFGGITTKLEPNKEALERLLDEYELRQFEG